MSCGSSCIYGWENAPDLVSMLDQSFRQRLYSRISRWYGSVAIWDVYGFFKIETFESEVTRQKWGKSFKRKQEADGYIGRTEIASNSRPTTSFRRVWSHTDSILIHNYPTLTPPLWPLPLLPFFARGSLLISPFTVSSVEMAMAAMKPLGRFVSLKAQIPRMPWETCRGAGRVFMHSFAWRCNYVDYSVLFRSCSPVLCVKWMNVAKQHPTARNGPNGCRQPLYTEVKVLH